MQGSFEVEKGEAQFDNRQRIIRSSLRQLNKLLQI